MTYRISLAKSVLQEESMVAPIPISELPLFRNLTCHVNEVEQTWSLDRSSSRKGVVSNLEQGQP